MISSIKNLFNKALNYRPGRETITFMVFLLISAGLWLVMTLNDEERHDYTLSINIEKLPHQMTITTSHGRLPQIVVQVREKALNNFTRRLTGDQTIDIEFADFTIADGHQLTLSSSQLTALLHQEFSGETTILKHYPDSLSIPFTVEAPLRLPVKLNADIKVADQYTLGKVEIVPVDSVSVYYHIDADELPSVINTERINLINLTDTTTVKVALNSIPGARIIPDSIELMVPVEALISKTFQSPITVRNVPAGSHVVTFPLDVTVTCFVPLSRYNDNPPQVNVVADYTMAQNNRMHLSTECTDSLITISVSPQWVEFLTSEKK